MALSGGPAGAAEPAPELTAEALGPTLKAAAGAVEGAAAGAVEGAVAGAAVAPEDVSCEGVALGGDGVDGAKAAALEDLDVGNGGLNLLLRSSLRKYPLVTRIPF